MQEKLHILFLCGWYPSKVLPHNGDFIQRHAEAVALQHKVSVIHIITDSSQTNNINYSYTKINEVHTHIAYIKAYKNPFKKAYFFLKAYYYLRKKVGNFNLIHLNKLYPFGLFTLFSKKPYIISEHWTGYHQPQCKNIGSIEKFFSKLITKKASAICPVSNDLKNSMLALGLKGNYSRVGNVVNTQLFTPNASVKEKDFTIIHVSNMLDKHKNVSGILHALHNLKQQIQNITLILIGENSAQYKILAKKLNLLNNIKFIDQIPHHQVVKNLQKANVFVLFSNYENLPCVILESFSCGTPVISTNVGGISEFFPEDFGYLLPQNNTKALVSCLLKTYHNPINIPQKMHQYIDANFSTKSIATQFSQLYYKALNG